MPEPGVVDVVDEIVVEGELEAPREIIATPVEADELEKRLTAEEEIEARVHESHETPHFRKEVD